MRGTSRGDAVDENFLDMHSRRTRVTNDGCRIDDGDPASSRNPQAAVACGHRRGRSGVAFRRGHSVRRSVDASRQISALAAHGAQNLRTRHPIQAAIARHPKICFASTARSLQQLKDDIVVQPPAARERAQSSACEIETGETTARRSDPHPAAGDIVDQSENPIALKGV
jgi:hypothetical protein